MISKDTSNFERKRKDKSYILLFVMISLVIFAIVVASIQLRTDEISQYLKTVSYTHLTLPTKA